MPTRVIVAIIVVVVIILVVAVPAIAYSSRQRQLRRRFGPEYDHLVAELHSRRKAEAELADRQRRVRDLNIQPLDQAAQARYAQEWEGVQAHFVDAPDGAVLDAQRLMMTVMNERGYPTEQDDQILADLSVDHANVLDHYRVASNTARGAAGGTAATEDLRQAMIHYRVLFRDLVGDSTDSDEPVIAAPAAGNGSSAGRFRPGAAVPDEQVPAGPATAPADTAAVDTAPDDTDAADTTPDDTASADAAAPEPDPAQTAPAEDQQDDEVGRAG
jgi:hypothetical protein